MRFLTHGEDVDPAVDIFDREASFLDKYLGRGIANFPA
jgi:dihydroorotase